MNTSGKWETVNKPKKTKHGDPGKKKVTSDSMPKLNVAEPLKESSTIYDILVTKEEKDANRIGIKGNTTAAKVVNVQNNKGSKPAPTQKKKEETERKQPTTLEEAVKHISLSEVQTTLAKTKAIFPNHQEMWLKDLVSLINLKLEAVPEKDPIYEGKPYDYPLRLMPSDIKHLCSDVLKQCSEKIVTNLFNHCVNSMTNDVSKNLSSHGYRMFIQLLAFKNPKYATGFLVQYHNNLQTSVNRPLRCLAILWTMAQIGYTDLALGLDIWFKHMYPFLRQRALAPFIIDYLEELLRLHPNSLPANAISQADFFTFFDLTHSLDSHQTVPLQKKLKEIYPSVKKLAYGDDLKKTLHVYFPALLSRLDPSSHAKLKAEILQNLVFCLSHDPHCYSVWLEMYTKQIPGSGLLIRHLVQKWEQVQSRLDRKRLLYTVSAFNVTNQELATQQKGGGEHFDVCSSACKDLLRKLRSRRFPLLSVFLLIVTVLIGLYILDVYTSKSAKASRTAKFLRQYGVLQFLGQVGTRVSVYTSTATSWIQERGPVHMAWLSATVGPYLKAFWQLCFQAAVYVAEITAPLRAFVLFYIKFGLEQLELHFPGWWEKLIHVTVVALDWLCVASIWIWSQVFNALNWIILNVFSDTKWLERVFELCSHLLLSIYGACSSAAQWLYQQVLPQ